MPETNPTLASELRRELIALLDGGQAHATFDAAVKDFPANLRGIVPDGLPYSGWQIVEHLRIAQRDVLDFSNNADGSYKSIDWPGDYWPRQAEPPDASAWDAALAAIRSDRQAFDKLLHDAADDALIAPFPWGKRQTLLREALVIADHNAYHVGELIVIRRLLHAWKK